MTSVARGTLAGTLVLVLFTCLLISGAGCVGTQKTGSISTPAVSGTVPATVGVQTLPTTVTPPGVVDLSSPPPKASPVQTPPGDAIVGKWYAPPPDDLTLEFFADGTFTERSPNFRTFHGSWRISEEEEAGFYDATVLDRWGFQKQVHILITSGNLYIKSMGTLHRV